MDKQIESSPATPAAQSNTAPEHATGQDPIHMAAKALGGLPKNLLNGRRRTKRKWTGFVGKVRMWVGQPVILPDGAPGWVKSIQRGYAVVRTTVWDPEGFFVHDFMPVLALKIARNPDAVLLGGQKRGKLERHSEKKAAASRLNGAKSAGRSKKTIRPCQDKAVRQFLKLGIDYSAAID
jgi:hypothetical protein